MPAKFDTSVQELKYKVLKEIAKGLFNDTLLKDYNEIPKIISPGPRSTMRCCIYKERAIVQERIKLALGGNDKINNVVEVIDIACDECPLGGYEVTNRCRGCIAHRCEKACHKDAIKFSETTRTAFINKDRCINCGMCAQACQYNAIQNFLRPCEQACKVKAISVGENNAAVIDDNKCIQCGACVHQCPFGAIMDKSYIGDVIKMLKDSDFSKRYPVIAVVAPSIAAQAPSNLGKLVSAIKKMGFSEVVEAALGADLVANSEAQELAEKGFLTSSCCPSFVSLIEKYYPELKENISHNLSPMASVAKVIKEKRSDSKIVFIGPCVAKKQEIKKDTVKPYIDSVLTFEEMQAMIDALEIDIDSLEDTPLDNASYFGRIFARSGGVSEAVKQAIKEHNIDFEANPTVVSGIDNCRLALAKAKSGNREFNFIEGMGCVGGCIGGPCCLNHERRDVMEINRHSNEAKYKTISSAIDDFKNQK